MHRKYYNKNSDKLYVVIYKLGEGVSGVIYFSIVLNNYMKNIKLKKTNFEICAKALKIYNECSIKAYHNEIEIMQCVKDGMKCDNILYVDDYSDDYVVFDVMDINLESLFKMFKYNLPDNIVENILNQMENGVKYLHNCGRIHYDIKPENFLLGGLNDKQKSIMEYAKKYNFRLICNNDKSIIHFYNYVNKYVHGHFDGGGGSDSDDSDEDEDDDMVSDYDTDENTFISYDGEFEECYDKFCVDELCNDDFDGGSDCSEVYDVGMMEYYKNKLEGEFVVKLCDFGLMKNRERYDTCNTRCYRRPENILGGVANREDDLWALYMIRKELESHGKLYVNICEDDYYNLYNNNLIHIKMYYEKTDCVDEKIRIYDLILNSNRRDAILCDDGSFLFYRGLSK